MAVTRIKEARHSGHLEIDAAGSRHFVRTWRAWTNTIDGPLTVVAGAVALGLPDIYDQYTYNPQGLETAPESDANAVVRRHNPVRHPEDPRLWTIGVEYETLPGFSTGDGTSSVEFHLPEVQFDFVAYTRAIAVEQAGDREGRAIVNSAGQPFEPKPEVEDYRLVCRIRRNEVSYVPQTALHYMNSINQDVIFGGVQAFQARLNAFGGTRKVLNDSLWWEVNYEIHFNADTWILKLLDQGLHKLKTGWSASESLDQRLERICDNNGLPVDHPVPLCNGAPITPERDPCILSFHIYKERAFAGLNLPALVVDLRPPQ